MSNPVLWKSSEVTVLLGQIFVRPVSTSEPTRHLRISYAVFCLKNKNKELGYKKQKGTARKQKQTNDGNNVIAANQRYGDSCKSQHQATLTQHHVQLNNNS